MSDTTPAQWVDRFRTARKDPTLVVVEGFHALKHAIRFGADVQHILACADSPHLELAERLAPDILEPLRDRVLPVSVAVFEQLAPVPHETGVIALARRPRTTLDDLMSLAGSASVVLLERPTHHGNVGAAVRVSAAAGIAGLVCVGDLDPWHPAAVRGGAGLQFALPVVRLDEVPELPGPWIALDPEGEEIASMPRVGCGVLAFGTERKGLSRMVLERADYRVRIPMQPGVSSLNLATSVAIAVYVTGAARVPENPR